MWKKVTQNIFILYMCVYIHVRVYMCVFICMYTYICIYIYLHSLIPLTTVSLWEKNSAFLRSHLIWKHILI
jgi:hypothetical protein